MATTTTTDGADIHYETIGGGRDVVLVHGMSDSMRAWGPIPEMLAADNRVTTLDLRGHGESGDSSDYSATTMSLDVAAVVDAAGIDRPLVIGHSLGGVVVSMYAAQSAVRGVINVDQPLHLSGFQAGLREVAPMLRDPATFTDVFAAIVDSLDGDLLPAELEADIRRQRRPRQEVVLGVWNMVIDTPIDVLDAVIRDGVSPITAPYLALMFVDAGPGYADWLHSVLPHALVEQWPSELGHYAHRLDPQRFVDTVKAFDPRD